MYADSRRGTLAQTTSLTSVAATFDAGMCVSFYLFLRFTKDSRLMKFRLVHELKISRSPGNQRISICVYDG